jgi:lysophospholipase L1-like esterase
LHNVHALALGIAGDQTQHLLWRLDNGEMPDALQPKVIVLAIGTNNLGYGHDLDATCRGLSAVLRYVREKRPQARVLLLGLLPRADRNNGKLPDPAFGDNIIAVNEHLRSLVQQEAAKQPNMVSFLDIFFFYKCDNNPSYNMDPHVNPKTRTSCVIPKTLMGDYLHPTALGHHMWADVIASEVARLLELP